ncbi:MAG: C-terminal binding protein [Pedosphaera sp.]|nr:C-terminal binding protein [Pedosphaera sp.]
MPRFKVVLVKHGYPSVEAERKVVTDAGGEFIDADLMTDIEMWKQCTEADAILVRWHRITPELIKQFHRCKIVIRYGIGFDNVDVNAATAAGIIVGHIPAYCVDEVSSHTIALLLACVRKIVATHNKIQRGGWDENPSDRVWRMTGRTLGLVGLGKLGQAVARKMSGWGLKLLASDPYLDPARAEALGVTLVDLDTLCRESDYISLHVPLLPETRHLISRRELELVKPGAILINTSRGPVLDTEALLWALDEKKIARAGLDVFESEPLPANSPLRTHPHVIVTDHVAWYSEESQIELKITAAEEAVRVCLGGLPLAVANPEVLHKLGRFAEWKPSDAVKWQFKRLEQIKSKPM